MSQWQPIETAYSVPNNAHVLVFSTKYGISIAYRSGNEWSQDTGYATIDEVGFYLATPQEIGLTHWMPLPAPPTAMMDDNK